jgi:hypothetical protein
MTNDELLALAERVIKLKNWFECFGVDTPLSVEGRTNAIECCDKAAAALRKCAEQKPVAYVEPATGFMRLVKDIPPSDMETPAFKLLFKTGIRVWLYAHPVPAAEGKPRWIVSPRYEHPVPAAEPFDVDEAMRLHEIAANHWAMCDLRITEARAALRDYLERAVGNSRQETK